MKVEPTANLPLTLGEVTADAMTRMLGQGFPGTEVTALHFGPVISGTCTKARLLLDYNEVGHGHGLPATMCLKAGFESHGLAGNVYPREVWFYQHLADRIGGSLPKCYFAGRNQCQAVILMEDLLARNARFGTAADAASVERVRSLLQVLAAVHGTLWESNELAGVAREAARGSGCAVLDFSDEVLYQPAIFERMMKAPRAAVVPRGLRDLSVVRHYLQRLTSHFDQGPRCLIHGDAHLGNTYFQPDGTAAAFIDWQTYTRGHWAFDVSYLLCTGLTTADRRLHEEELIRFYLDQLEIHGGKSPSFAAAWHDYRCMAFYGFAWAVCPPELQREEICENCAGRVIAAIADLETLDALDGSEMTAS